MLTTDIIMISGYDFKIVDQLYGVKVGFKLFCQNEESKPSNITLSIDNIYYQNDTNVLIAT